MRSGSFASGSLAFLFVLALSVPSAATASSSAVSAEVAASLASYPAPSGLTAVWHDGSESGASTIDLLERSGFRVEVALPPHLFYVRSSEGRALPAGFAARGNFASPSPRGPLRVGTPKGLPFGARWRDTSEFMIGRVAVSILFPESDGSTDPDRYDWTPALRDSVVRAAVRGLAKWTSFATLRGVPLTFALEVHPALATRYEPIDRTVAEEDNWIQDVLSGYLGFRSDVLTLAYDAANGARSRLGASWGVLMFAVQDDSSATGQFPDGFISHARLGGPWFVTPLKNGGAAFQGATMDTYIEHEIAHSFWALDEHFPSSGWWACSLTTGYLNIPNYNSVVPAAGYCGTVPAQCLMKGNYPDSLCRFTSGQVGWADRDLNGTPDLLETRPAAYPDSDHFDAVAGASINLHGHALEIPLWNQNPSEFFAGDSISIAVVDSVRYRIDGGTPVSVPSEDGVYDSGREYFTATIPPLAAGTYTVDWEAWNSNGQKSANNLTTTVVVHDPSSPSGSGGDHASSIPVTLRAGPTPSAGAVRFSLRGRPGSEGQAAVHDVQGRLVARWRVAVPGSGVADWSWSAKVAGGQALPSGLYFLSLEIDGAQLKRRLVISH